MIRQASKQSWYNCSSMKYMSQRKPTTEVRLNVYDTSTNNAWTKFLGLGKYHSGIVVYDKEYIYRVPDGVTDIVPQSGGIKTKLSSKPVASILLGETDKSRAAVLDIVAKLSVKFSPQSYDPLDRNSNHFAERLSIELCKKTIPQWVNLVADVAGFSQATPIFNLFRYKD